MSSNIICPIHLKLIYSFHSSFPGLWLAHLFSFLCSHWLSVVTSSVSALVPVKVKWAKTWSPFTPPEWLQSSGVSGTGMQVWVRTTMPWSSWDKITNHWGLNANTPGPCLKTLCSQPTVLLWASTSWVHDPPRRRGCDGRDRRWAERKGLKGQISWSCICLAHYFLYTLHHCYQFGSFSSSCIILNTLHLWHPMLHYLI